MKRLPHEAVRASHEAGWVGLLDELKRIFGCIAGRLLWGTSGLAGCGCDWPFRSKKWKFQAGSGG